MRLLSLVLTQVLALGIAAAAADEQQLIPRIAPAKPPATVVTSSDRPDVVIVKFKEGTDLRFEEGSFSGPAGAPLPSLQDVLRRFAVLPQGAERLYRLPAPELQQMRAAGEASSGRELADLSLYYRLEVPAGVDAAALCDALNALPYVELATPAPEPAPLPAFDIAPATPRFVGQQKYRTAPPRGIGVTDPRVRATKGAAVAIVDIEYSWVLDHEDFNAIDLLLGVGTPDDPFPQEEGNHGTAVLGVLAGAPNRFGVTGLVPQALIGVAPAVTVERGYDVGHAVLQAASLLIPGDVILIEQQMCVCNLQCTPGSDAGFGPVEWLPAWFDVIAQASALGITVVEAAGNGAVDLDQASCQGRFNRQLLDSGAIIVGAGHPTKRSRLKFSSYGSRVDLQGWGRDVTTAGYGELFDPTDLRQRYTNSFSGTSSASPIVAAAAVAIQSVVINEGFVPLAPRALRQLLVDTGTPQKPQAKHIGPLPNIPAALDVLFGGAAVSGPEIASGN